MLYKQIAEMQATNAAIQAANAKLLADYDIQAAQFEIKDEEIKLKDGQLANLKTEKESLDVELELKRQQIYDKSLRTRFTTKKLKIFKVGEKYKVSANSRQNIMGQLIDTYIFPATIDIRQEIRERFHKTGICPEFDEAELPGLDDFIMSLIPKN